MSLESLFAWLATHRNETVAAFIFAPVVTWLICQIIPGRREEPYVLSVNLSLAVVSLLMWVGYLAYATNTGGWDLVVKQADILLLLAPPYYVIASLLMSRQRLPLHYIPAFKTLQGLVVMGAVFFAIATLVSRMRIIIFSYLPLSTGLWILAGLLGIGYWGYRRIVDQLPPSGNRHVRHRSQHNTHHADPQSATDTSVDEELEQLRQTLKRHRKR